MFVFVKMGHVKFWFRKILKTLYMERRSSHKTKLGSVKLLRSVFRRLKISMILMEFLLEPFKWNLFLELLW